MQLCNCTTSESSSLWLIVAKYKSSTAGICVSTTSLPVDCRANGLLWGQCQAGRDRSCAVHKTCVVHKTCTLMQFSHIFSVHALVICFCQAYPQFSQLRWESCANCLPWKGKVEFHSRTMSQCARAWYDLVPESLASKKADAESWLQSQSWRAGVCKILWACGCWGSLFLEAQQGLRSER